MTPVLVPEAGRRRVGGGSLRAMPWRSPRAIAGLINRTIPPIPSPAVRGPDAAELTTDGPGPSLATPFGRRCPWPVSEGPDPPYPDRVLAQAGVRLPGLLPLLLPPARRWGQSGLRLLPPAAVDAALSHIRDHDQIWEVILSRARSADRGAAATGLADAGACRHRPRQGRALSQPRAGGGAPSA